MNFNNSKVRLEGISCLTKILSPVQGFLHIILAVPSHCQIIWSGILLHGCFLLEAGELLLAGNMYWENFGDLVFLVDTATSDLEYTCTVAGQQQGQGTLSNPKDWNWRARFKWSPFFHCSWSHWGHFVVPSAFCSQNRRSFALMAFSSLDVLWVNDSLGDWHSESFAINQMLLYRMFLVKSYTWCKWPKMSSLFQTLLIFTNGI